MRRPYSWPILAVMSTVTGPDGESNVADMDEQYDDDPPRRDDSRSSRESPPAPQQAEPEPTDPRGWVLEYRIGSDATGQSGNHWERIGDCYDIHEALEHIAMSQGVCTGTYRTRAPSTWRGGSGRARPMRMSVFGDLEPVARTGPFAVSPSLIINHPRMGYDHIPAIAGSNLAHRTHARPVTPVTPEPGETPAQAHMRVQLTSLHDQMRTLSSSRPATDDMTKELARIRLENELRRVEREREREDEERKDEIGRRKRQLEWDEEERRRSTKLREELAVKRQEAEEERARARQDHEQRMAEMREESERQMRREESAAKRNAPEGGLIGEVLTEIRESIAEGGGLLGLLRGQTSDEPGLISDFGKIVAGLKDVAGLARALPGPSAPPPPKLPMLPIADSAVFPALPPVGEEGMVVVRTPIGYGVRTPYGLAAVPAAQVPAVKAAFARLDSPLGVAPPPPPAPDEESDEESDVIQGMAMRALKKDYPELALIVARIADEAATQAASGALDPTRLARKAIGEFTGLDDAQQAAIRSKIPTIEARLPTLASQFGHFVKPAARDVVTSQAGIDAISAAIAAFITAIRSK